MFHRANFNSGESKSESNRLCPAPETAILTSDYHERNTLACSSKQQQHDQHQHHCHDYNSNKEESKSQAKLRNFHSLSQAQTNQEMQHSSNNNNFNQRIGQHMTRSTTNPQLYQAPPFQHASALSSQPTSASKSVVKSESFTRQQSMRQGTSSTNPIRNGYSNLHRDEFRLLHNSRQDKQTDRETDELVTMIKEEIEHNPDHYFKESEVETLSSLERDLPVELSFLIRQQAFCMARMNYLDRQIRELKESGQATNIASAPPQQVLSTSANRNNNNRHTTNINAINTTTTKNGNFILSDDSGGEYSRATISDDDELSSLLDQIAKSVRPERNVNQSVNSNQQRANYSVISNPTQQYAILNPNQLHHQAVPVFVMGSPIAVAHPSSISSNILPGVHFQPEPRYNQYYEDFYIQSNNSASPTMHRHNGLRSSRQFDSSISAIEQLVSQKEKRQIKSQLKSADNWLKMRSSGMCNINDNFGNTNNGANNGPLNGDASGSVIEKKLSASSSSAMITTENSNIVIDGNRSR